MNELIIVPQLKVKVSVLPKVLEELILIELEAEALTPNFPNVYTIRIS